MATDKLSKFRPATKNANQHTPRGLKALGESMGEVGFVSPMTAAADGEMLDGSARLETAFDKFGDEAIVIHHDGTKPIVMVRDDIPNAHTTAAKKIAYAANRIGQIDLSWDPLQLASDLEARLDLDGLWNGEELSKILEEAGALLARDPAEAANDPNAEWQGMPEFNQEDKTAFKSIHVHFANFDDMNAFAELVGQKITDKTRSIWYPEAQKTNMKDYYDDSGT